MKHRTTKLKITSKQWAEAIKILKGEIDGSRELTMSMNQKLRRQLRGPFAHGMTQQDAVKVIDELGWRITI